MHKVQTVWLHTVKQKKNTRRNVETSLCGSAYLIYPTLINFCYKLEVQSSLCMIMNPDHFQNFFFILFFLNLQHIGNVVNAVAS